jgi:hypothetical protein
MVYYKKGLSIFKIRRDLSMAEDKIYQAKSKTLLSKL